MPVGQDACGGTDPNPLGPAQQMAGEGQRRGTHPVGDEMMLGDPHPVEAGPLAGHRVCQGVSQSLAVAGAGKLTGQQEQVHAQGGRDAHGVPDRRRGRPGRGPALMVGLSSHEAPGTG